MILNESAFLKDVASHQMRVISDNGINRHIRFQKPGTMCMHFDLITWPGHLCYTGDMGTFVFSRLEDMFQFFRTDADSEWLKRRGLTLGINPGYWGEKLEAIDTHGGIKEFNDEEFERIIKEYLIEWVRDNADSTTKEERRELWDEVMYSVIGADGDSGGHRKTIAAHDFRHHVNDDTEFCFRDIWERSFTTYTFHFLWCCYALAWGIKTYDSAMDSERLAA